MEHLWLLTKWVRPSTILGGNLQQMWPKYIILCTPIGCAYLLKPRHSTKPSAIKHLTLERRSNDLKIQFEKINDPWLMSLAGAAFQSKCWKSTTLWSIKGKWFAVTKGHKNGFNSWCKARTKPLRHKQCHEPSGSQPANQESNSITPTHNSGNALGNYVSGARRTLFFLCYFLFIVIPSSFLLICFHSVLNLTSRTLKVWCRTQYLQLSSHLVISRLHQHHQQQH